ncbi:MAG: von Willebrand factor type A domain-containing protein [Deltaproteobacteria bacterium]|nr:von Willebrand factor type A domain-containing protein [Deltaproteobacteria bacterium]
MPMGGAMAMARGPLSEESPSRRADPRSRKMASRDKGEGDLGFDRDAARDELERSEAPLEVQEAVSAGVNPLIDAKDDRLSTFAIDVDTGSWTLAKRFLQGGSLPNANAVRVEEWVNAFSYSYPAEGALHPFTIHLEGAPLAKQSMVLRVGIQGKEIEKREREPAHLTFLVDVSGSMSGSDRLPLAKRALGLLIDELNAKDSVSLVTYAGSTRVVLPATRVTKDGRETIRRALNDLRNGGGTAMGSGMELAYQEATKALGDKGNSRVIVLSDGDANIGRTGHAAILQSIKGYVSEGVTLSTVGFGTGNYRDHLMEQLADAGNGNYSYVGSMDDAKKIFVDKLTGTLQVIAKDTKIQVEMNPEVVASYRLIGYENRDVADRDFRNDKVDAGEIGAGHTVTALYEVVLKDDEPKGDIATVRVRYKQPKGTRGIETATNFTAGALRHDVRELSADGRFATGIGLVAEALRHSPHMDRLGLSVGDALRLMESGVSGPHAAERREAVRLIAPLVEGAPVAWR